MTTSADRTAPAAAPEARSRLRRVLPVAGSLLLTAGIFYYFVTKYADTASVWAAIREMTPLELAVLAVLTVWNLATYGFVMTATMPGLTYRQAMVVTETTTAIANTVPGGGALAVGLSYRMYSSWGFSRSRSTVSLLVSGIWNNFAKLAMPVLALAALALTGTPSSSRVVAGLLGVLAVVVSVVGFALVLRSEELARRTGDRAAAAVSRVLRLLHRPPVTGWDRAVVTFRARTVLLLRARWHWITVTTLVSHLSLFAVLLVALRDVGVSEADASWAEVLAIYSFARLLTAVPLTPGGVGIIELALITGIAASGGDRAPVVAAVLVFRALTWVLPIPLGILTYLFWQHDRSWRRPPGTAPRTPLVPESDAVAVPHPRTAEAAERTRRPAGRWRDLALAAGAAVVLVLCSLAVDTTSVSGGERGVFRLVNDAAVPFVLVWPVMQLGNLVAVPVAALAAAATRRLRLAAGVLLGGPATYVLAKVVKDLVVRGRPARLLPDVHVHGAAALGRGYPSGHAAVVALLATVALPHLGRRARAAAVAVAVLVCLARVQVGAHLPLDVVAGAALGVAVGGVVRLLVGRPRPCS